MYAKHGTRNVQHSSVIGLVRTTWRPSWPVNQRAAFHEPSGMSFREEVQKVSLEEEFPYKKKKKESPFHANTTRVAQLSYTASAYRTFFCEAACITLYMYRDSYDRRSCTIRLTCYSNCCCFQKVCNRQSESKIWNPRSFGEFLV